MPQDCAGGGEVKVARKEALGEARQAPREGVVQWEVMGKSSN